MTKIKKNRRNFRKPHKVWQLQEAKARFSQLIQEVEQGSYHTITKNGQPVAVLISTSEFERIQKHENSLLDFFSKSPFPDLDLDVSRSNDAGRDIDL